MKKVRNEKVIAALGRVEQSWYRINLEAYESSASDYADKVDTLHPHREAATFLTMIPPNGKIIDIGCGYGRDAKIFSEKGYKVTGIDFSPKMIKMAKSNVPQADFHLMDMRSIHFISKFDGAWANSSLLHLSKRDFGIALGHIFRALQSNGCFYIKLKSGSFEGVEHDKRYNNLQKCCSYYEEDELKEFLLSAGFAILDLFVSVNELSYQTHPYLNAFCIKKLRQWFKKY